MTGSTIRQAPQILLVDDDENLLVLIQDYLGFRGYEVVAAKSGGEALQLLSRQIPDMIVCDILMPGIDGYEFVERVRQDARTSWLPVLFLTAKDSSQDRVKGLNRGADVYMAKPFEPEELVAQVESSLQQTHRLLQRNERDGDGREAAPVPPNVRLTRTETRVVRWVAQGLSNRDIAQQLNISQRTVESHVSNMLNKTRLHNRTELARWAIEANVAL